ncbi:hypothetical protein [Natronolimnobius baerhuensis]|uniref:PGF-CTERM sorting domain-containing protein n=1 Tax=Natronolimnobius baerhuensis TaxID=253108 RepID=A0A202E515_9EURY|nr:hypothetical protein [Natronolimnobius baerhuensis]OVE83288.1 PGF-CTERM sorting domain-containing protein [Natronolimnobius baerhuensis]
MTSADFRSRRLRIGVACVGGVVLASIFLLGVGMGPPSSAGLAVAQDEGVSEDAAEIPAPEPGDPFFEEAADDGSWVSYINPRDEYREPYLGEGSGKICVTLLNEAGEPITGESVPDTTATISTGESLEWHGDAEPFTVEFPLTEHYDRPFDSDQFGTDPDVPQGDGYMDSHCLEWHGLPEDETVEYGAVELEGEHADDLEVVGYVQQAHEAWDTDVDPLEDAVAYDEVGGWTYETDASHGQVVAVLQLAGDDAGSGTVAAADDSDDDGLLEWPIIGGVLVVVVLVTLAVIASRR